MLNTSGGVMNSLTIGDAMGGDSGLTHPPVLADLWWVPDYAREMAQVKSHQ